MEIKVYTNSLDSETFILSENKIVKRNFNTLCSVLQGNFFHRKTIAISESIILLFLTMSNVFNTFKISCLNCLYTIIGLCNFSIFLIFSQNMALHKKLLESKI